MFDKIAPTYDLLNWVLSLGLHRLWEKKLVGGLPHNPRGVYMDLCTGTGAIVPGLLKRCARVVGVDISPQMLGVARRRYSSLTTCEWIEGDAQQLPFEDGVFDSISLAYGLRNIPDRVGALREMLRVSKPQATLAILEFGQPSNRVWGAMFGWYSRVIIPAVGAWLSGTRAPYEYLPKSSAIFPCGEACERLLQEAGWKPLSTRSLCGGVAFIYIARKER